MYQVQIEGLFLNVVQALETYHSRFITNDIEKYKQRVDEISKSSFSRN